MDKTICINLTNVLPATFNVKTNDSFKVLFSGGGGYLGKVLLGMCVGLSEPLPLYSLFCDKL